MRQYKLFVMLIQALACIGLPVQAGFERIPQPSSVFARGFSGVSMYDADNLWLNPASQTAVSTFQSSVFYSPSPFQLPQLSNSGLIVATNLDFVNIGFGLNTFGFSLYRESVGTMAISDSVTNNLVVGVGINVNYVSIDRYGSRTFVGFDVGMIANIFENVSVGTALHNFNRPALGTGDDEIPQQIIAGISIQMSNSAVVNFDLVKDIRYPFSYRVGVQYELHEIVTIRSGITEEPSRLFGGIGIAISMFRLDYGVASHTELGLTHSLGITFRP